MRRTLRVASMVAFLVGPLLVACGGEPASVANEPRGAEQSKAEDDRGRVVLEHLASRFDSADYVAFSRSLVDYLPNVRFAVDGKEPAPLGAGIVVGTISDVSRGRAYAMVGRDAVSGTEVAYDSPDALWRTLDVTVEVQHGYGSLAGRSTVRFGVSVGTALAVGDAIAGLEALGTIVLALDDPGFFDYDSSLYSIGHVGGALGQVGEGEAITFPILDDVPGRFTLGAVTLSELERSSRAPDRVVVVREGVRVG